MCKLRRLVMTKTSSNSHVYWDSLHSFLYSSLGIGAILVYKNTAKQFGKYLYIEIFPAEIVFLGFLQVKRKLLLSHFQNEYILSKYFLSKFYIGIIP